MRKALILLATAALVTAPSSLGRAEPRGTTCGLTGKATFSPGLTVVPGSYKFSFKGKLADCESTGDVTSGKVSAKGTADAACEGGTAQGKAKVKWNTRKKTIVKFSTVDVGALVTLEGQVTKSKEKSFGKGDAILGELVFEADPTECAYGGLGSANFTGQVVGGSPN